MYDFVTHRSFYQKLLFGVEHGLELNDSGNILSVNIIIFLVQLCFFNNRS